ncbi:MAG: hypothetical protein AAGA54_23475 [Myxococcota bacterium]
MSVLARYQTQLAALLRARASPEEIRTTLGQDPALAELRGYIESLADAPLKVAAQLAARWANLGDDAGPSDG